MFLWVAVLSLQYSFFCSELLFSTAPPCRDHPSAPSALRLRRLTSTLPGLPGPLASCGFDCRFPHDFSSHGGSFVSVSTYRPFLQASNLSPGFRKTVPYLYLFWPRVVTASHHSQLLDPHSPSFSQPSLNPASCLQRIPLLTSPQ